MFEVPGIKELTEELAKSRELLESYTPQALAAADRIVPVAEDLVHELHRMNNHAAEYAVIWRESAGPTLVALVEELRLMRSLMTSVSKTAGAAGLAQMLVEGVVRRVRTSKKGKAP